MKRSEREVYEMKARVVRAIAHPVRVAIVEFLRDGERCVCEIAEHVVSERSNVSRHLGVMVKAGVLRSRKEGLKVIYSLRTPCIAECLDCVAAALREQIKHDSAVLRGL